MSIEVRQIRDMNYSRFISAISKARKRSAIREATALLLRSPPSMISLGAGSPNPITFPFKTFEIETTGGKKFKIEGKEMSRVLQYSQSDGIPELKNWIKKLHQHYHHPPLMQEDSPCKFDLCITAGSQSGLMKALEMLLTPGDSILVDDPNYTGTLAFLRPLPINILPVDTDEFGMKSTTLRKILRRWDPADAKNPDSDIPKVIYTIPNCGNPTGATASEARRREIYKIAQEYDLVIVEDDPYYFLQFNKEVPPSYQALDTDGRVIRSDSMSKVLSSGMRLGWVSGAQPFLERIILHQQVTDMHNSTLTQVIMLKLFEDWQLEGFQKHVDSVKAFYKSQRDAILGSANKWLHGLAEWNIPEGGMFLWVKLPGVKDTRNLIQKRALEKEVILIPGFCFVVNDTEPSSYVRASFSLSSPEDLDEGIRRLAELIRDEIGQKS